MQDHLHEQFTSKQNTADNAATQQISVSEKNESEKENEKKFSAPTFDLSFIVSCFQLEVNNTSLVSAQPLTEKTTNPIYIAVRNFRI